MGDGRISPGTDVLQRFSVPGGWLYRNVIVEEKQFEQWETTVSLCFVPITGSDRETAEPSASVRASVA
jgi:hypothetical protein